MLILFDIDGTLLRTQRMGVLAVGDAGRELFGAEFREDLVDYAGGLDPVLFRKVLTAHDLPCETAHIDQLRAAYGRHLQRRLATPGKTHALPGVAELIDALRPHQHITLGLLTGNFPETGAAKIAAAGLNIEHFHVRVWGCDSPHEAALREHLPPVAVERYRDLRGADLDFAHITIIGDTIHDVRCAKAHGCRALAVATGGHDRALLEASGADLVADDLSDTEVILEWLINAAPVGAVATKTEPRP